MQSNWCAGHSCPLRTVQQYGCRMLHEGAPVEEECRQGWVGDERERALSAGCGVNGPFHRAGPLGLPRQLVLCEGGGGQVILIGGGGGGPNCCFIQSTGGYGTGCRESRDRVYDRPDSFPVGAP